MMNVFGTNTKKVFLTGAAAVCAASLLAACSQTQSATQELPAESIPATSIQETNSIQETSPLLETAATFTEPAETVDMESMMEESSITITSYEGQIGDYDFFTCNETQLFGDYSIAWASYEDEEYLMLSYNGLALLAKEDGSGARLFYNGQSLELPFSCRFNVEYQFLQLCTGDFIGNGGSQLVMIIPIETGSGIDIEELQVIDLDSMSVVPIYTQDADYEQNMRSLFDAHFAEIGMTESYELFDYVQYMVEGSLIFTEYGACDEDGLYLSFLEGTVSYDGTQFSLSPAVSFTDEPS